MLAKVIGYGATRDDARRVLAASLRRARLHGVATNRDLLVGILREPEFAAGQIDTGYLDRHRPEELNPPHPQAGPVHPLAVALAGQAGRRAGAPVLGTLPSGWRNNPSAPQRANYELDGRPAEVSYRFGREGLQAAVDGTALAGTCWAGPQWAGLRWTGRPWAAWCCTVRGPTRAGAPAARWSTSRSAGSAGLSR